MNQDAVMGFIIAGVVVGAITLVAHVFGGVERQRKDREDES